MIKEFRFSSIENIKSNISLFDDDLKKLKAKEEQEKDIRIISSLENGNIHAIFENLNHKEQKQTKMMSSDLEFYFNMMQDRFTKTDNIDFLK